MRERVAAWWLMTAVGALTIGTLLADLLIGLPDYVFNYLPKAILVVAVWVFLLVIGGAVYESWQSWKTNKEEAK